MIFFNNKGMHPLISISDIIKFDFRTNPIEDIAAYIEKLAGHNLCLLAEKAEIYGEFNIPPL